MPFLSCNPNSDWTRWSMWRSSEAMWGVCQNCTYVILPIHLPWGYGDEWKLLGNNVEVGGLSVFMILTETSTELWDQMTPTMTSTSWDKQLSSGRRVKINCKICKLEEQWKKDEAEAATWPSSVADQDTSLHRSEIQAQYWRGGQCWLWWYNWWIWYHLNLIEVSHSSNLTLENSFNLMTHESVGPSFPGIILRHYNQQKTLSFLN